MISDFLFTSDNILIRNFTITVAWKYSLYILQLDYVANQFYSIFSSYFFTRNHHVLAMRMLFGYSRCALMLQKYLRDGDSAADLTNYPAEICSQRRPSFWLNENHDGRFLRASYYCGMK